MYGKTNTILYSKKKKKKIIKKKKKKKPQKTRFQPREKLKHTKRIL